MKKIFIFLVLGVLIINTSNVIALTKESNLDFQNAIEKSSQDEFDMVIISTEKFADSLVPLIEHKNSHGLLTYYKEVIEIYDEYPGRDKPEKIKYFIKDAIETNGVSYVFLVGGIDLIPIRYTYIGFQKDHIMYSTVTDLYYADIYNSKGEFCSWDSNNDNVFSQIKNDEVDLYPDVHIGRIPCYEISELVIVIDKIINYENSAYSSDWFNKVLYLSDEFGEWISDIIADEMENLTSFESIKLYPSKNTYSPKKINQETTNGAGFLSYIGHGSEKGLTITKSTYRPIINWTFAYPIKYKTKHLEDMNNGYRLPIAFFDACLTAIPDPIKYKFPLLAKLLKIPNKTGFAYEIVKKEGGGAIAAIGATRVSGGSLEKGACFLHLHFFLNYEPGISVGKMLSESKNDLLDKMYPDEDIFTITEIEIFNLIGDPSLKVGGYP